ncbi:MAG: hypothetical protein V8R01_01905 [Bacilli bacterium]
MKTKKRKLKIWVKMILFIGFIIGLSFILALIIDKALTDFDKRGAECDQAYGHTCSPYEIRQFSLGK